MADEQQGYQEVAPSPGGLPDPLDIGGMVGSNITGFRDWAASIPQQFREQPVEAIRQLAGLASMFAPQMIARARAVEGPPPIESPAFSGRGIVADPRTRALYQAWRAAGSPPSYETAAAPGPKIPVGYNPQTGLPVRMPPEAMNVAAESAIRRVGQVDPSLAILARTAPKVGIEMGSPVPERLGAQGVYHQTSIGGVPLREAFIRPEINPEIEQRLLSHEALGGHNVFETSPTIRMRQEQLAQAPAVEPLQQFERQYSPRQVGAELPARMAEAPYAASLSPHSLAQIQYMMSDPNIRQALSQMIQRRVWERTQELRGGAR